MRGSSNQVVPSSLYLVRTGQPVLPRSFISRLVNLVENSLVLGIHDREKIKIKIKKSKKKSSLINIGVG